MERTILTPESLGALAPAADALARAFVTLACDFALLVDDRGVVVQAMAERGAPRAAVVQAWVGRPFAECTSADSRLKAQRLLAEAGDPAAVRRRELNHSEVPVSWSALRLGTQGPVLVVGRDLSEEAGRQQSMLQGQIGVERAYWLAREGEARREALAHVAHDGVLVIDLHTHRVERANAAAARLLPAGGGRLLGRPLEQLFDTRSGPVLGQVLDSARLQPGALARGTFPQALVRLALTHESMAIVALHFRSDFGPRAVLRAWPEARLRRSAPVPAGSALLLSDMRGTLQLASESFVRWTGAGTEDELRGQPLGRFLVVPGAQALAERVRREGLLLAQAVRLRTLADAAPGPAVHLDAALLTDEVSTSAAIGWALQLAEPHT